MKYSELLTLYKDEKLDNATKKQVEADIERHEAISEYLFEQEEETGIEALEFPKVNNDFDQMVNRAIRRVFIKIGICIIAITLGIVIFLIFFLPEIVDSFYYNPEKSTGEHGNQLGLDLAVYTELCIPANNRKSAYVTGRGYGNYDIIIPQDISYNDFFINFAGKIEKGTLLMYDADALNPPVQNAFAWFQMEGNISDSLSDLIDRNKKINYCAAGDVNSAAKKLIELNESEKYTAYVTLDKIMPYEKFMKYLNRISEKISFENVWCAVCTKNGIKSSDTERFCIENLGFNCALTSSHNLDWDREKYPYMLLWDGTSDKATFTEQLIEDMQKEEFMKTHFTSLLRYMAEQKQFLKMMGRQPQQYSDAADYVEKNGLMVYGFVCIAGKDSILKLQKENKVYEIYTQAMR